MELIHIKKQTKAYNPNTPSKLNPERMFQSKVYMEEYLKTQIDFFDSITASDEDAERYRKQWPKTETVGRIFTEGAAE